MIETIILSKLSCFPQYSQNGCFSCHSHDDSIDCGYCSSIMSCVPRNECSNESWHYLNEYCDDKFCSSFTSKRDCKYPCAYSRIKGCIYNVEYEIYTSKLTSIALIIVSLVSFLILSIVCAWPCYTINYYDMVTINPYVMIGADQLKRMQQINLDEIPTPAKFKQACPNNYYRSNWFECEK